MPTLPWQTLAPAEPGGEYLALASYLPLRRVRALLRFLRWTAAVKRQLDAGPPGLVGYSLRARLLRLNFWTLSVWADEEALRAFVGTPPHRDAMALARELGGFRLIRWVVDAGSVPPSWRDALARLSS